MSNQIKNTAEILAKLEISSLNPMQEEALDIISKNNNTILLSPTGSGKTVAFLLPIIADLDPNKQEVQTLILVPSRELALQIEQVIRVMGTGFKANAVYGGQSGAKDKLTLNHLPAILIGTPGRIASHLERETFDPATINTLVLDEFDKSLEVGFETEMRSIIKTLSGLKKRILTSATFGVEIPNFIGLQKPVEIDYLSSEKPKKLEIKRVLSPEKDKLATLVDTICHIGNKPGIVFCNYKDTIDRVSEFLTQNKIEHSCFYGGMEQIDREKSLLQFRNGSTQLLIATDLAARGIDIPELAFIIHYQLPFKEEEFTHRNGRTARMHQKGIAYVIHWDKETLPDFMGDYPIQTLTKAPVPKPTEWKTVFISGGRKDKISKGDIAGLFCKQGNLTQDQIGAIELQQNCAYVAVHRSKANQLIQLVNNSKLKNKKVRISLL